MAGAQEKCTAPAKTCFVDHAVGQLQVCQLMVSLGMELQRLNGTPAKFDCIDTAMKEVEPMYARAAKGSKPAAQDRLKDFYASWRAALNGVRPDFQEIVMAYKARQSRAVSSLSEKAERIKLE